MSSDSCFLLLLHDRVWDSDIIVRAVYEGTAKLCYLVDGDDACRSSRLNEYWNDVPAAIRAKRSDRVAKFLANAPNPSDPQWEGLRGIIVDPAEAATLRASYPRERQRQLTHRWSFHEIIESLSRSQDPGFKRFIVLSHGYGNGSHLSHQDWNGVGMIWERSQREPEAEQAVHDAHVARILLDLCVMALMRAHGIAKITGGPDPRIAEGWRKVDEFLKATSEVTNKWTVLEYGGAQS
jgi:hypothetical protein